MLSLSTVTIMWLLNFRVHNGICSQKPAKARRKKSFRTTATSEQDIWEADEKGHAFRSVARMLRAGQPYTWLEVDKEICLPDIKRLLGGLFDIEAFPVWGGRSYISSNKHAMLPVLSLSCT